MIEPHVYRMLEQRAYSPAQFILSSAAELNEMHTDDWPGFPVSGDLLHTQ